MARTYIYADVDSDIRVAIEKLTDSVMIDSSISYWIDKACDYIDSRLGNKWTVPFTTTPPIIRDAAIYLTCYSILRIKFIKSAPEGNDWIASYKNDGIRILNELLDGTLTLKDSSGVTISPISDYGVQTNTEDYQPIFNEGDEVGWTVSSDKITNEGS